MNIVLFGKGSIQAYHKHFGTVLCYAGEHVTFPMDGTTQKPSRSRISVASGAIADSIDLRDPRGRSSTVAQYKEVPRAVFRIASPKIASLIFSSGKVVLTGIRDRDALDTGLFLIIRSLQVDAGRRPMNSRGSPSPTSSARMTSGVYINLNKVVITLNLENIEYEPEQFSASSTDQGPEDRGSPSPLGRSS